MRCLCLLLCGLLTPVVRAGVHYSAEKYHPLPSQWRGFLLDHRSLRMVGANPGSGLPVHFLRQQYNDAALKLEAEAKTQALSADKIADLGALYIRLNKPGKAIEVLRPATRLHPQHFPLASNLATAWQANGELADAERAMVEAVRLAPPAWKKFEEFQLKLIRARLNEKKNTTSVDDLFGVAISRQTRDKLPADDLQLVQQLALWFPSDGRVLWLLGELAYAHGDIRTAAAILEGCVSEFALASPECRQNRKIYREEADRISKLPDSEHAKYRGDITFKSGRPCQREFDGTALPEIRADGVNLLPWPVLNETTIEKPFKPQFLKYLKALDGKQVYLTGYMQPVSMDIDVTGFMLVEYPVGCWFCETPEPPGIVFVDMGDKLARIRQNRMKISGILKLNSTDPEDFLYTIRDAKISEPD